MVDFPLCFLVFSRFSTVDISLMFIKEKSGEEKQEKEKKDLLNFF